jgi:hypothetical protein
MNDTTTVAMALTADDLAAWRIADSYSLHTNKDHDCGANTLIRLYCKAYGDPAVFTTRQQILFPDPHMLHQTRVRDLFVEGRATGYKDASTAWSWPSWSGADDQEPVPSCFYSGYDMRVWATIGRALRVGSVLRVLWVADNNTEIARDAGLHLDSVDLEAVTGKHTDRWNVGHETCRDNTARMIKRQR